MAENGGSIAGGNRKSRKKQELSPYHDRIIYPACRVGLILGLDLLVFLCLIQWVLNVSKNPSGPGAESILEDELGLYEYNLPPELIAQEPAPKRDGSRLLHLEVGTGAIGHHRFSDLGGLLRPGDVLVVNQTKVVPARLLGRKKTGGRVEVLLLTVPLGRPGPEVLEGLVKGAKGLKPGLEMEFGQGLRARVVEVHGYGRCGLLFQGPDRDWVDLLNELGRIPLPPYIKRAHAPGAGSLDAARYQTVYAQAAGAVAAPTAGLHFTPQVLADLESRGIERVSLTLHVGYGTFKPVTAETLAAHRVDPEEYVFPEQAADVLNSTRSGGGRVVAVGTKVTRVLESCGSDGRFTPGHGTTDLYIYPPYAFRAVDVLQTNFHLPRSSLLALVCAFAGTEFVLDAYRHAVKAGFRFYSYGDVMLIL